jgi:hypothetical protein
MTVKPKVRHLDTFPMHRGSSTLEQLKVNVKIGNLLFCCAMSSVQCGPKYFIKLHLHARVLTAQSLPDVIV